jgi:acyl dehydratase
MATTTLDMKQLGPQVGREIAVSPWCPVTQDRIDRFAEATEDRQWIHVDRDRAAKGPYGTTIAHGFLTLSLVARLAELTFSASGVKMGVNYGLNKVRFTAPVPSGSSVRARFKLAKLDQIEGGVQITWGVTVEREGSERACLFAEWLVRYYF